MIDATFSLIDHHGLSVSDVSYRGKYLLVFFGFTHCRVVCPRALTRLSKALDLLGPMAERITPLYISVDPERDNPNVMAQFLATSYPRFTGLTGTREQAEAAKRAFRVFAQRKSDAAEPDGYVVPHTAFTYVLDQNGRYVTHFADTVDEVNIAAEMRKLIRGI